MDLKDAKTQRTILIVLGLAVIGYLFFVSSWLPFGYCAHAEEIDALQERYDALTREVTQAQQAARRRPLLEEEYAALSQQWEAAQQLLPEAKEVSDLLREITIAGQAAGVEFMHVIPRPPVPRPYVTEHPIEVKVMGGFHQMGTFLGEVSSMDRLLTMSLVEITGSKSAAGEEVTLEATFLASAYTLGGAAPAQQEDGGAQKAVAEVRNRLTGRSGSQRPAPTSEE
ncbi:MAG: type 4a pilus biogenesis protein PilO [Candidatus Eisenbacteria bacterium]|nr:type 4a pilus biogenesis protein PilO [Candidatus Eisenbacteria bacterium]